MAEVFGTIGNEHVELNNAATEATLRMLLQATLTASKQSIDSVKNLAKKTGLDPAEIESTNRGMNNLGKASIYVGSTFAGLDVASKGLSTAFSEVSSITSALTSGNAQVSQVFGQIARLGGPIGLVATGAKMLAEFQETQLASYRSLTQVGVNFGGSLTDLRLAASNSYMTMSQFTQLMSQNSDTLVKMGGTADGGAKSFTNLSKAINSSQVGKHLSDLGFTTEQINQGMLNYIATTGGRSKAELANVESIKAGTAAYLEQLDRLAAITGKSREDQEKAHKQAMFEADVQSTMARMTEQDRIAFGAAMKEAAALHGQAGRDIVLAQAQGRAVTGEAGKMLAAIAPASVTSIQNLQSTAKQFGASSREFADVSNKSVLEAQRAFKGIDPAIISVNKGLGVIDDSFRTAAAAQMAGLDSQEAMDKREAELAAKRNAQKISEASAAAQAEKRLNELGQAIMNQVTPTIARLLETFNPLIQSVADFLIPWVKIPGNIEKVLYSLAALSGAFIAMKIAFAWQRAQEMIRGSTPQTAMWVRDVSTGGAEIEAGPGKSSKKAGKVGKVSRLKGLAGGAGAVLGGLALDMAGDYAKEKGFEKTGAGLDIASSAATWAGTGAMLGSVVPGLGTVAGGAIGGLAGGAYGLYQNWGSLFGSGGKPVPKPATPENTSAAEQAIRAQAQLLPGTTEADPLEKLAKNLERLNTQTVEMIRYLRDIADQARRNVEATRQLSGNLYPQP